MAATHLLAQAAAALRAGELGLAEQSCREHLVRRPDDPSALQLLGVLHHHRGEHDVAAGLMRRAVGLAPGVPDFHANLAAVLGTLGCLDESAACLREALRLRPGFPQAHNNLGVTLEALGRLGEAAAAYREAARLRPGYAEAWANLGNALRKAGRVGEATAAHRASVAADPAYADGYRGLAADLLDQCRVAEAVDCYRRLLAVRPELSSVHSDLLHCLHYDPRCGPDDLYAEHLAWADRHARPRYPAAGFPDPDPDPRPAAAAGLRLAGLPRAPDGPVHRAAAGLARPRRLRGLLLLGRAPPRRGHRPAPTPGRRLA